MGDIGDATKLKRQVIPLADLDDDNHTINAFDFDLDTFNNLEQGGWFQLSSIFLHRPRRLPSQSKEINWIQILPNFIQGIKDMGVPDGGGKEEELLKGLLGNPYFNIQLVGGEQLSIVQTSASWSPWRGPIWPSQ